MVKDQIAQLKAKVEATLRYIRTRKQNYQQTFSNPWGQAVLQDLAVFCRAAETPAVPGDRDKTFMLLGRNEVWQRIQQNLQYSDVQLYGLYTGRPIIEKDVSNE